MVGLNRTTPPASQVSVIFTVLNDATGAVRLLEALLGQTRRPDEIVVVDGGSTDGTLEALHALDMDGVPLRVTSLPGINIAEGRNQAITLARHDLIACTDAGSVPDQHWLERLVAPFSDADVTVVGGAYALEAHTRLERVVGRLTMPGQLAPLEPARFNPSARSMAFRREAWRRAGGFPDWLYTAEDTLFDLRLRTGAEVFAYAEGAIVRWRPRSTLRAVWKQFANYARGEAHIGRGADAARFWLGRYALVALVTATALLSAALTNNAASLALGGLAAALLLAPVHTRARDLARRTQRTFDYLPALFVQHWVAAASIRGQYLGQQDRRRRPKVFVDHLRAYWGDSTVGEAPLWRMKQAATPRTLIVSWHWPPANRASAQVLANLFRHAPTEAFHVLTRAMPRVDDGEPLEAPPLPTDTVAWPLAHDRDVRFHTYWASIRTTLGMILRARRVHADWPLRRVLTVYPHRYGLLAGWLTARMLGVPLVVYMHDLFAETSISHSRLKRAFWALIDHIVLRSARLVLVPTREFADHYRRRGISQTWVLPHCRPMDVPAFDMPAHDGPLRLLYTGSIYQAHEDAIAALVRATDARHDVAMTFLTNPNRILSVERVQWLPRARMIEQLASAHVLVVALGENTPYPAEIHACFPSKIVDYLAARRPILAIVPPGCFVDRLIRATGCGVSVIRQSPDEIGRALDTLRDPATRRVMCENAARLDNQLGGERWMTLLCRYLADGPPPDPCTPEFPASQAHAVPIYRQAPVAVPAGACTS